MNFKSPDFKHKATRKALWIDGWTTPPWVKAMLALATQGKLQSPVGYHTNDSQETAQPHRYWHERGTLGMGGLSPFVTTSRCK